VLLFVGGKDMAGVGKSDVFKGVDVDGFVSTDLSVAIRDGVCVVDWGAGDWGSVDWEAVDRGTVVCGVTCVVLDGCVVNGLKRLVCVSGESVLVSALEPAMTQKFNYFTKNLVNSHLQLLILDLNSHPHEFSEQILQ